MPDYGSAIFCYDSDLESKGDGGFSEQSTERFAAGFERRLAGWVPRLW